jgi:hypothetical protein
MHIPNRTANMSSVPSIPCPWAPCKGYFQTLVGKKWYFMPSVEDDSIVYEKTPPPAPKKGYTVVFTPQRGWKYVRNFV